MSDPASAEARSQPNLIAIYTSPSLIPSPSQPDTNPTTTSKTFTFPIIITASSTDTPAASVKRKTDYLSSLRASTKQLQEEINEFLTARMVEEKKGVVVVERSREEVEEERYEVGEEEQEEAG